MFPRASFLSLSMADFVLLPGALQLYVTVRQSDSFSNQFYNTQ